MGAMKGDGISRRAFLKVVGAGAGAISLSQFAPGLTGCGSSKDISTTKDVTIKPPPAHGGNLSPSFPASLVKGQELVGKVTSEASTIRLVAGEACVPSTKFRLLYDTSSHKDPTEYPFQGSEISGFSQDDPITFGLNSLSPSTRYYYRAGYDSGSGWVNGNEYTFHTQRQAGESFRFCIATDMHVFPGPGPAHALTTRTYKNVLADSPDILISIGDDPNIAYQGLGTNYPWPDQATLWKTLQTLRAVYDEACHSMSFLYVLGNHEGLYGWTTQTPQYQAIYEGLSRYLPLPDDKTFPEGGDPRGRYGALTWGDALFVWLDVLGFCDVDPYRYYDSKNPGSNALYVLGDAQKTFLQDTLAHSSASWKFVFAHHLVGGVDSCDYRYGRGNANGANQYEQAEIQKMMIQYGAHAFFYGHDHVFSVSEANGIPYICAGAGSACPWIDTLKSCYNPYLILATDSSTGQAIPGHVRVDVSPTEVTMSYIKASFNLTGRDNGTVVSSYTIKS